MANNYACITLLYADRIRLIEFPSEAVSWIQLAVFQSWPKGISYCKIFNNYTEFKLNGYPWGLSEPSTVHACQLMISILTILKTHGYHLTTRFNMAITTSTNETLLFRQRECEVEPRMFAISLKSTDLIRVINASQSINESIELLIQQHWPHGIQKQNPNYARDCVEFKLRDYPWADEDKCGAAARMLLMRIFTQLERQGWYLLTSIAQTCARERKASHCLMNLLAHEYEVLDPTPDIWSLFQEYNLLFFDELLSGCEVKWSKRMTLCAGLCSFQPMTGFCSIRLSEPLLKLRPRSDLVNTLLHEMIHAFLFLNSPIRDREDHGPQFQYHMNRINAAAQTKITVYHTFNDEVDTYRVHWWKCDGPCQHKPPYFGLVKRAMNRAPGPRDPWWNDHVSKCGGVYTKIKEPENYKAKKAKREKKAAEESQISIANFFTPITTGDKKQKTIKRPSSPLTNVSKGNALTVLHEVAIKKPRSDTTQSVIDLTLSDEE